MIISILRKIFSFEGYIYTVIVKYSKEVQTSHKILQIKSPARKSNHCGSLNWILYSQLHITAMAAVPVLNFLSFILLLMAMLFFLFNLQLAISNKVLFQQTSGTLRTQANPLHVGRHLFILRGEILRVKELVHLDLSPFPVFHSASTPSSSLHQSRRLIIRAQEDYHVNFSKINP